jgi:hypothetical protein
VSPRKIAPLKVTNRPSGDRAVANGEAPRKRCDGTGIFDPLSFSRLIRSMRRCAANDDHCHEANTTTAKTAAVEVAP